MAVRRRSGRRWRAEGPPPLNSHFAHAARMLEHPGGLDSVISAKKIGRDAKGSDGEMRKARQQQLQLLASSLDAAQPTVPYQFYCIKPNGDRRKSTVFVKIINQ